MEFFCMEDLSLHALFIYLTFCLYQYGLMDFFQYLDSNPIVLILLLKLFPALAIESRVPLTYLHHCFCWLVCLFVLSAFIFCWRCDAPGSSCIFTTPALKSANSPRNLDFFYWRKVLETSMWALDVVWFLSCCSVHFF